MVSRVACFITQPLSSRPLRLHDCQVFCSRTVIPVTTKPSFLLSETYGVYR